MLDLSKKTFMEDIQKLEKPLYGTILGLAQFKVKFININNKMIP